MMNPAEQSDAVYGGRLRVKQLKSGYRFSIDAVLLAHAVQPSAGDTVVDLGTGCGIIALILADRYRDIRIHAVEIQPSLACIAAENVAQNAMADRIVVSQADMRTLDPAAIAGPVRWVVSNPPYRRADTGRVNPDPGRAVARHEIAVNMAGVVASARRLLPLGGKLSMIYPAERLADVVRGMSAAGIEPKLLRLVHSAPGSEARRVLATGVRGGRPGLHVPPPLYIHGRDGDYTPEVAAMFS